MKKEPAEDQARKIQTADAGATELARVSVRGPETPQEPRLVGQAVRFGTVQAPS